MRTGGGIIIGLYAAVIVESATIGIAFNYALLATNDYGDKEIHQRDTQTVLLLTFLYIALICHILTIPCLCFAVQMHSATGLIPYLVWRMLLSIQIVAVTIWQATVRVPYSATFADLFYRRYLPLGFVEIIIGTLFFGFAMRAHREFGTHRIRTSHSSHESNNIYA